MNQRAHRLTTVTRAFAPSLSLARAGAILAEVWSCWEVTVWFHHAHVRPSGSKLFSASAAFICLGIFPILAIHSLLATLFSVTAAGIALAGGWRVERNPTDGIALLLAAFGITLALGLGGILSVGLIFIFAGMLILLAISTSPNPNGHSWFGLKFILPETVAFAATLALIFR